MDYRILPGDNRETLKTLADNSIDAIVTDPPYGIDFLGKSWDANVGAVETYRECLRVLKPGGHILAFSAARTYHHLAVTLEQAGFEIRDQIMWIYSSGFPKSQDIGRSIQRGIKDSEYYSKEEWEKLKGYTNMPTKTMGHNDTNDGQTDAGLSGKVVKITDPAAQQWSGWGTQLKPAHEPICLARKPMRLSIAQNCQEWGVGALNIDATRVPYDDPAEAEADAKWRAKWGGNQTGGAPVFQGSTVKKKDNLKGLKAKQGAFSNHINAEKNVNEGLDASKDTTWEASQIGRFPSNVIGEILQADYQKYFYCPKVSRAERHIGYVDLDTSTTRDLLLLVDGKYVAEDGTLIDANTTGSCPGKMVYVPGVGKIFAHGLKHEVEKILKASGREAEIPKSQGNNHPTVKPIELMKYLIRLITPPGGTVLDPFTGSGSTGMAAVELGHPFIGCELDPAYVEIARTRIEAWYQATRDPLLSTGLFDINDSTK